MTDAVKPDSTPQDRDHVLERVRTLEVRLARHFAAIELQERQRGRPAVPRHEYGDGSWCNPEAIVLRREALEEEIEGVVAGGSPRTVTSYELAALGEVTERLAVELLALNLREPAVLRTYAEWVIEALTTPRSTPRAAYRGAAGVSTSKEAGRSKRSKLSISSPSASPTFQQTSIEPVTVPATLSALTGAEITTP